MSQKIIYLEILMLGYSFRYGIHESYSCRSAIMYDIICTINGIAGKLFYNVLMLIILTVYCKVPIVDFFVFRVGGTLDNLEHGVRGMQIP